MNKNMTALSTVSKLPEIRVFIYGRFSSSKQKEESLDAQELACRRYCKERGWEVVGVFHDKGKSGMSTEKRDEFNRMLENVKKNKCDVVIVRSLDRFARNAHDAYVAWDILKRNNVKLVSTSEDLDGSMGNVMFALFSSMAEQYIDNLREITHAGQLENAKQSKFNGGIPPLGYDVKDGEYILNKREAEAVKFIFDMYDVGYSYDDIITKLKEKGYKTKIGNDFKKTSLKSILENERYKGVYVFNKVAGRNSSTKKRNSHLYKPDDEVIRNENAIPVIIEKELFDRVQERMKENRTKAGSYKSKENYVLKDCVYCGVCGSKMTGNKKNRYTYYSCAKHRECCATKDVNRDYLEIFVFSVIADIIFDGRAKEGAVKIANTLFNKSDGTSTNELQELQADMQNVLAKRENILKAIESGAYDNSLVDRLKTLNEEECFIEKRLSSLEKKGDKLIGDEDIELVKALFVKYMRTQKTPTVKEFIHEMIKKITVTNDTVTVEFNNGVLYDLVYATNYKNVA